MQATLDFDTPTLVLSLKDVVGICQEYKRFHGVWPQLSSSERHFRIAGIRGFSGPSLTLALRDGGLGLARDPEYQALRYRLAKDGHLAPDLSTINPQYTNVFAPEAVDRLIESVTLAIHPAGALPGFDPRNLSFSIPLDIEQAALEKAGVPGRDLLRNSATMYVRAAPIAELGSFVNRAGMVYGADPKTMPEHYDLRLSPEGSLYIKYSRILGGRFVTDLSAQQTAALADKIAQLAAPAYALYTAKYRPSAPPVDAQQRLSQELALLTTNGASIILPQQRLVCYDRIKILIEDAGGRYVQHGSRFTFDKGIDPAEVLESLRAGQRVNQKQQHQFFATPEPVARDLVAAAGDLRGVRVLEPSAGDGAIADIARAAGAEVVTVEAWSVNAHKLRDKGYATIERDFLTISPAEIGTFDVILANPPFTRGADIDHCLHMLKFLNPGGRMSVIMSTAWSEGKHQRHRDFLALLDAHRVRFTNIPAGAFAESGTSVPTVRVDFTNYDPSLTPDMPAARKRAQP